MKLLLKILGLSLLLCCESAGKQAEYFWARVTYYTGPQTASGRKPVQGITIAAEKKYKFGHRFHIPDLKKKVGGDGGFVVHDRGPAVEGRKASRGKLPVIDVYVTSRTQLQRLAQQKDNIFKVYLNE
jgi:hypothetical protein